MGKLKNFPYKLMVVASLLYDISIYKIFHRHDLLSDIGGKPVLPCIIYGWGSLSSGEICPAPGATLGQAQNAAPWMQYTMF